GPARAEVHTPQALAALLAGLAHEAFPAVPAYKAFFSNSGTEAIEAGLKLAQLVRYRRLVEKHGMQTFDRLMRDLEIPKNDLLDAEGGVKRVLAQGKVPKDLVAAFVAEPFQGEGGYRLADRKAFQDLGAVLSRHGILFMMDEVQTFGRTGAAFCAQHFLKEPDILATAKGAVVGVTLARAELEQYLHPGWHSNTWGGGKIFDNEMAW